MLTRQGVNKVAEMLRAKRQQAQRPLSEPESVPTAEPAKKEEWRPGEGQAPAPEPTGPLMATALRSRNLPNRKRLSCTINGAEHPVIVRDTAYYRQGEQFEVRLNDYGQYEASIHRMQPRFR